MLNGIVTRLVRRTLDLFSRSTPKPSTCFYTGHGSGGPVGLSLFLLLSQADEKHEGALLLPSPDTSIHRLVEDVEPLAEAAVHLQLERNLLPDVDLSEPLAEAAVHLQLEGNLLPDVDLSEPLPEAAVHLQLEGNLLPDVDLSEPLPEAATQHQLEGDLLPDVHLSEPLPAAHLQLEGDLLPDVDLSEPLTEAAEHLQLEGDLSEPLPETTSHLQLVGDLLPEDMSLSLASPSQPCPGFVTHAQLVSLAFVHEYYSVLQTRPEHVFRFYEESSTVSRPDLYGTITTVTTIKAINDMVLDYYKVSTIKVETVDSLLSCNDGILVAVVGCMTWPDMAERRFCQSFLLGYQGMGLYLVHNDVLRFISETQPMELIGSSSNVSDLGSQQVAHAQDYELRDSGTPPSDGEQESVEEVYCT